MNFEKIGWDVIPFALKRRKIESVKQVIWNITHRVKFCTISSLHGYFHHSSHFFLRLHRSFAFKRKVVSLRYGCEYENDV